MSEGDRIVAFEAASMWDIRLGRVPVLSAVRYVALIERQVQSDSPIMDELILGP